MYVKKEYATKKVLIPLNSGLVFTLALTALFLWLFGLNPFEFRAGIYSYCEYIPELVKCLNPFEFRAGIYSYLWGLLYG